MRKSKYTDSQILALLKKIENDLAVRDLCREHTNYSIVNVSD